MEGRLARNPLKGALGDALHAVMCGAGHNLRLICLQLKKGLFRASYLCNHPECQSYPTLLEK